MIVQKTKDETTILCVSLLLQHHYFYSTMWHLQRLCIVSVLLTIDTTAIPIPYPRYGTFIDFVHTTRDTNLLRAQIASYDDVSLYDMSPVYSGQWNPINWTFATIYVDSGRITAGEPTSELTPRPEPQSDPMLDYSLAVDGAVAELTRNNTVIYSLNFSSYIDTNLLLDMVRENYYGMMDDEPRIPTASFVSQSRSLVYIFFPECISSERCFGQRIRTRIAIIDLSRPSQQVSLSVMQPGLPWDAFGGLDDLRVYSILDSVHICLLPNNPFAGNSPLYAFYDRSGVSAISSGSYYFPFSSILDAMVVGPSGNSTLNTAWEVHHNFSLVEMENPYNEWEALVPVGYEIREKTMTGDVKRSIVLDTDDVLNAPNLTEMPQPTNTPTATPQPTNTPTATTQPTNTPTATPSSASSLSFPYFLVLLSLAQGALELLLLVSNEEKAL